MGLIETLFPKIAEERQQAKTNTAILKKQQQMMEALPVFAQDTDEGKWDTINSDSSNYTELELADMRTNTRLLYYQSPSARGIIETLVNFIMGKNASVDCLDESDEVQEYWDGYAEFNNWDLRSKEIIRRTFRDGEVFLRRFPVKGGEIYRSIRFINASEIQNPAKASNATRKISKSHCFIIDVTRSAIKQNGIRYRQTKSSISRLWLIPMLSGAFHS